MLNATRALFEEGGYAAATIEAIAARSGVAKTTIYRWWHNRPTLVVELLLEVAANAAPLPTGRDPMQAIRTELRRVTEAADALPGRLLLALLSEAQRDVEVRNALLHGLFDPRRQATARVIRQAQSSGVIRKNVAPLVAVDLLFGPIFYRRFVRQEPVSRSYVNVVYQNVLDGLTCRSGSAAANGGRAKRGAQGRAKRKKAPARRTARSKRR